MRKTKGFTFPKIFPSPHEPPLMRPRPFRTYSFVPFSLLAMLDPTILINQLVDAVIFVVDDSNIKDFIIGYRFSPEEYEEPGIKMEDTLYLVDKLADKKLDYLHISLNDFKRVSVSEQYKEKSIMQYVHEKIGGRIPLISIGDVRTKQDAEDTLTNAELVAVGRSLIIDPHWTSKVLEGKEETIRRVLANQDREELVVGNGIVEFLNLTMPDRLR